MNQIKINSIMLEKWLEASNSVLPQALVEIIDGGFIIQDDCVFLKSFLQKEMKFEEAHHHDKTGFECFVNHLHIDDFAKSDFFETGLKFLFLLGKGLKKSFAKRNFRLILSVDESDCNTRFHCIRANENWLTDDLDSYKEEGVFVIDF